MLDPRYFEVKIIVAKPFQPPRAATKKDHSRKEKTFLLGISILFQRSFRMRTGRMNWKQKGDFTC